MRLEKRAAVQEGREREVSEEQLAAINRHTRRELGREEVYVFSVILCDNEVDRDLDRFPRESLEELGRLFLGRTGVFDHVPKAENQAARIFETRVEEGANDGASGENSLGEPYCRLRAWAYMVRSERNADLILEIDGGIKKEVSVGCAVGRVLCSVCGQDQKAEVCGHKKGRSYDGKLCHHLLAEPTDAYEWSFVAVPAQRCAGVTKRYPGSLDEEALQPLGEASLEKLVELDKDVLVSRGQLEKLAGQYRRLERLARAGEAHLTRQRREVVRLALLAQPELEQAVMEKAAAALDGEELDCLEQAFRRGAGRSYPLGLQLGPVEKVEGPDSRFRIR